MRIQCVEPQEIFNLVGVENLDKSALKDACPLMLFQLQSGVCRTPAHVESSEAEITTVEGNKKPTSYEGTRTAIQEKNRIQSLKKYGFHLNSLGLRISFRHADQLVLTNWSVGPSINGKSFLLQAPDCVDWPSSGVTVGQFGFSPYPASIRTCSFRSQSSLFGYINLVVFWRLAFLHD